MRQNIKIKISFFHVLNSPLCKSLNFFPSELHAKAFEKNHYKLILFSIDNLFDRSCKTRSSIRSDSSFNPTETSPEHFVSVLPSEMSGLFLIFTSLIFCRN